MAFKLELTEQEVAIIGKALGSAPYELVAPVIANIQRQIDAQQPPNGGRKAVDLGGESRRPTN